MTGSTHTMTIDEALAELGASPALLSDDEKKFIDDNGYLVIRNVLSPEQLDRIARRLDEILAEEGDEAGKELHQEAGTERMAKLVDKGAIFRDIYANPKLLATVSHILGGDVKYSSLSARFAKPGEGSQVLHRDYGTVPTPGVWEGVNSAWLIDDFTEDNGATRIIPGSHLWLDVPPSELVGTVFLPGGDKETPPADLKDPAVPHPQQKIVTEKAGSVVVFNCNVWHSGTLNRTEKRRRAIYSSWIRRNNSFKLEDISILSDETMQSLSPADRVLLDI